MTINWDLFGLGFFVGGIAVLGLAIGVKILFSTMDTDKKIEKKDLVLRYTMASLILVGQFLASAYLLMNGPERNNLSQNLSLGLGLIGSIFFMSFIVGPFFTKNRKKQ